MDAARSPWQLHIIGPQAVGKMTVGQEISRLTGAPLLHNHRVIDLLTDFFPFGSPSFNRLVDQMREGIFKEAAISGTNIVATGAWPFDDGEALPLVEAWRSHVLDHGGAAYFVELSAPLEVRLERNRHEHRRAHKKTDWATDEAIRALSREHRWNSTGDFPWPEHHLLIDNTRVPPDEVARLVIAHFGLPGPVGRNEG